MKSQVSFLFDGEHNKQPIIDMLSHNLAGVKYVIKKENKFVYRIFVAANGSVEQTFKECRKIQSNSVIDTSVEL